MYKLIPKPPEAIPLKTDFPCLEYDFLCYCDLMRNLFPFPLPDYLKEYDHFLNQHATAFKSCEIPTFPDGYRTYIIDSRFNILFAALDTTGIIATWFSKYGRRGHLLSDYCYGDGSLCGDAHPTQGYYPAEIAYFSKNYGFIPVEEFSMSAAFVLKDKTVEERVFLSQYQTTLLIEKFRSKNVIEWKFLINEASSLLLP